MGITAEALSGQPVGPLQYVALTSLFEEPGVDQKRLAATMGIDRTNTGVIVDELQAMGLLSKRPSASDRRSNELRLTKKGSAMRQRLRPHLLEANERILAVLNKPERELLLDLLARVIESNGQYAMPGAGRRPRGSLVDSESTQ
jgi:DNA-binding MarR family transcriptional regulator